MFLGDAGPDPPLPGVTATRVGYTGGDVPNATYRNHGTHAEAIEILFDPATTTSAPPGVLLPDPRPEHQEPPGQRHRPQLPFGDLLRDDEQKRIAEDTIADVDASGLWPGKVVTEVEPVGPFWEAEPEHQDYLQRYPNGYTCHFPRPGWKLPRRSNAA